MVVRCVLKYNNSEIGSHISYESGGWFEVDCQESVIFVNPLFGIHADLRSWYREGFHKVSWVLVNTEAEQIEPKKMIH